MKSLLKSDFAAARSQAERIGERKLAESTHATVCGVDFIIHRGVYHTNVDTELMAETAVLQPSETFLEVGCGPGAVSLLVAKTAKQGTAIDINPLAVANAKENAALLNIKNVDFLIGDGFAGIKDAFDVLICNPPYNNHQTQDTIERMFWDPDDTLKHTFFQEAASHLKPNGRIYFGWANFQDINVDLPFNLAERFGFSLKNITERISRKGRYVLYVLEFVRY